MFYRFPVITHINDVLPHIAAYPEFKVVEKDGYTVINYMVMKPETFGGTDNSISTGDAIRRECRGLIFDKNGELVSRPYHKFFNANEREETQINNVDISYPHILLDKVDGSMVRPFPVRGVIRWGTKMGITDTSMNAEVFVANKPQYVEFAKDMIAKGFSPIFEWVSPKNRIVIDYKEDDLVLTAVRDTVMGNYASYKTLKALSLEYNILVVPSYGGSVTDLTEYVEHVSVQENVEGVVVRFDNGHMLKIKCEWYLKLHKSKDIVASDRKLIKLILAGDIDDLKGFLAKEDLVKVLEMEHVLWSLIDIKINNVVDLLRACHISFKDRKDFAIREAPNLRDASIYFSLWDKIDNNNLYELAEHEVIKKLDSYLRSEKEFEKLEEFIYMGS